MQDKPNVTFIDECEPFEERGTRKGQCKYPFEMMTEAGHGMEVRGKSLSTVRQALKRWKSEHAEGRKYSVRLLSDGVVRIRRDK